MGGLGDGNVCLCSLSNSDEADSALCNCISRHQNSASRSSATGGDSPSGSFPINHAQSDTAAVHCITRAVNKTLNPCTHAGADPHTLNTPTIK